MGKHNQSTAVRIAQLSSLGIGLAVSIFGSLFVGVYLDAHMGTRPYLTIIMLLLGIAAGFKNLFYAAKRYGILPSPLKDNPSGDPRKKT